MGPRRLRRAGTRPTATSQKAPLTPEYQAIYEANLADQAAGGQGTDPTYICLRPACRASMNAYEPMEIVVTPKTTYMLIDHIHDSRRIFTDGRKWPSDVEPTFAGYSIGTWIDKDGDGRYDVLEVETRGFKGPRTFDDSGHPAARATTRRSSRSASISTRPIRTSSTTRSPSSTTR